MSLARAVSSSSTTKPDLLTIELAALLHDVLDKKYASAQDAADPYGFFLPFFTRWAENYGVDLVADGRARTIAKIVDNVSWSNEKKLRAEGKWGEWHDTCVELHCVQDADRLDAIGAFGSFFIDLLHLLAHNMLILYRYNALRSLLCRVE
jgi:uncharacterized protein